MSRTLLMLAAALLIASFAMFYVYADTYYEEETGGARVMVIAAAQNIPFGERLRPEMLTFKELPSNYVEDRHLRAEDLRRVIGIPLSSGVHQGEAVLRTDLSAFSDEYRALSHIVPQGRRAISIFARPESSFAGLLRPGDRVDVLLTVGSARIPESYRTIVLVQNLLVLSVGEEIRADIGPDAAEEEGGEERQVHWATQVSLEVDQEEAQVLTFARRQGNLRLILRSPSDITLDESPPELHQGHIFSSEWRSRWLRRYRRVTPAAPAAPIDPAAPPGGAPPGEGPAAPAAPAQDEVTFDFSQ